jgi:Ca2+/Na+ antiporter
MNTDNIFKTWTVNQSLGLALGWFFHSVISHLWTGDHEYTLTTPQFIMHNVSMTGCALIYLYFANRTTRQLFNFSISKYWILYLTIPTILFWVGFYLKAVPLDVLLWFLTIGFLNGFYIKKDLQLKSNQWLLWSIFSGLVGFIVGAVVLIPLDSYLTSLKGLTAHIVMFTLLGIVAGIPMALLGGQMLKRTIIKSGGENNE